MSTTPNAGDTSATQPKLVDTMDIGHIEWFEGIWIQVEVTTLGPDGRLLWPTGRPPTAEDWVTAYSAAVVHTFDQERTQAYLRRLHDDVPTIKDFWLAFVAWHNSVLRAISGPEANDDPRLREIRQVMDQITKHRGLPHVDSQGMARAVIRAAVAKRRAYQLGPAPEENLSDEDVLGAVHDDISPSAFYINHGPEGLPQWRLNAREAFDKLPKSERRRAKDAPREIHQDPEDFARKEASMALDAVSAVESQDVVQELLARCRRGGPAHLGAADHLLAEATREEASERHGATVDQIRHAERQVRAWLTSLMAS
jgi:hypothetical protein